MTEKQAPRVRMLIHQFHPHVGGAELQCRKLSAALVRRGLDVEVATLRLKRGSPRRERHDGVPVARLPRLAPAEANLACWLGYLWRHRRHFDVVHVHEANQAAVVAGSWMQRRHGKRLVVKCVNSGPRFDLRLAREHKRWPLRAWILRAVRRADAVIAISASIAEELVAAGVPPDAVVPIPNGVVRNTAPVGTRQATRRELGLADEACLVVRVGTLKPAKGLPVLLAAWRQVKERYPETRLISIGGEQLPQELCAPARALGESFRFVPSQSNVEGYLRAADVFVLPSLAEGLSNALLEAQAAGLPAVVTRVGGNPDVVEEGVNGLLVPPSDAAALADALAALIGNARLRRDMARAAQRIAERFDMDAIARRYERLYARLFRGRGDGA